MKTEAAVILAAGKGTRMHSDLPKVLHEAAGRPLVHWVVDACREAGIDDIVAVVGFREELVRESLADRGVRFVSQTEQLGTGHAAAQAGAALDGFTGNVFVLNGDSPLIEADALRRMRAEHRAAAADATVLYVVPRTSLEYGRLIRDADGFVIDVIEERDCSPDQKAIRELNVGFYLFNAPDIWSVLASLRNDNKAAEYYITDVPRHYGRSGGKVIAVEAPADMAMGVNTPEQLAEVSELLLARAAAKRG